MLKTCSLVNLNAGADLPSQPRYRLVPTHRPKGNSDPIADSNAPDSIQISDDNLEKRRKKRVILKSRQNFPSDFFNENFQALTERIRKHTNASIDLASLKPNKENSSASEGVHASGTPRFSSGMSIFSAFKATGKSNVSSGKLQLSSSKVALTEENESNSLSSNIAPIKIGKLLRSQSLMNALGLKKEGPKIQNSAQELDNGGSDSHLSKVESEVKNSYVEHVGSEKKRLSQSRHRTKRRVASFSSLQHTSALNKLRAEINFSGHRDSESKESYSLLSTDASSRLLPKDNLNYMDRVIETSNIEPEQFVKLQTPEKALIHLPVIKKEAFKLDLGLLKPIKVNSLPGSQREMTPIPTERQSERAVSSYITSGRPVVQTLTRVQSQGGTPGALNENVKNTIVSPFLVQGDQQENGLNPRQKIMSTKSIAGIHSSIMKSMNRYIVNNKQGAENCIIKPKWEKFVPEIKHNRGGSMTERLHTRVINDLVLEKKDDGGVSKENKDPHEFSFSKNFYKDKPNSNIPLTIARFEKGRFEKTPIKPVKALNGFDQGGLGNKGNNEVESDKKAKMSIVRFRQLQS